MKTLLAFTFFVLATSALKAETELTISGVHNCCEGCTNRIEKIINGTGNKFVKAGKGGIIVEAKSKSSGKKIVEALMENGFFGESGEATATSESASAQKPAAAKPAARAKMVKAAKVSGVHLCCERCASTLAGAIRGIPGVKSHTIYPKKEVFEVLGEFDKEALVPAMNAAGFHGEVR